MIAEFISLKALGYIGSALFLGSWLLQAYETRKAETVKVSARFFTIRVIASFFLLIESIRVDSLSLTVVNGLTCLLMLYNLSMSLKK